MTCRFTLLTLCVLVLSLITGCAINRSATADGAPLARQVTESDHCGLTAPGLVYVSSAGDLDKLAQLPSGNLALNLTLENRVGLPGDSLPNRKCRVTTYLCPGRIVELDA